MHERLAVNALCFMGSSLDELRGIFAELAPKRVSFTGRQVQDEGEAAARAVLASGGYSVETIAHGFTLGPLGDDEESWRGPRESLSRSIRFAQSVGARSIYMVTGGRGGRSWEEAAEVFSAAIAPCAAEARAAGVPLLIEPTPSVYAGHHLTHTLRDTVTLAQIAGIGVCYDISSAWTEAGLKESIERAAPILGLIQVGDYVCGDGSPPCRAVPGDGDVPLRRIFEWILGSGYQGGFDFELIGPRIDKEGRVPAVARAGRYMTDLLTSLGA
jgi:sugar phosphate isomerase/epimerase